MVYTYFSLIVSLIIAFVLYKKSQSNDGYNKSSGNYNKNTEGYCKDPDTGSGRFKIKLPKLSKADLPKTDYTRQPKSDEKPFVNIVPDIVPDKKSYFGYDDKTIDWCANFLSVDKKTLNLVLSFASDYYRSFRLSKRSGGYRTISAPKEPLLSIQKTIYKRVLIPVQVHTAATGFRQQKSIVNNAAPHLGKKHVLKADITDFFGSVRFHSIKQAFEDIGYPKDVSEIFANLCSRNSCLPQGAPTSPALSNIVAYRMDMKLTALAKAYNLTYTRYADDLTFSGDDLPYEKILSEVFKQAKKEGFCLKNKKTRFLTENKRKIITGISISSGTKMTIPKQKKRELRQNIHYILKFGLKAHQQRINSTDPAYLERVIGYLNFWLSVEPDNQYVIKSIAALKQLKNKPL